MFENAEFDFDELASDEVKLLRKYFSDHVISSLPFLAIDKDKIYEWWSPQRITQILTIAHSIWHNKPSGSNLLDYSMEETTTFLAAFYKNFLEHEVGKGFDPFKY